MPILVDLVYVAGTIAFFALMLAYVAFCAKLGSGEERIDAAGEVRP